MIDQSDAPILEVQNVKKHFGRSSLLKRLFRNKQEKIHAVDGIDMEIYQNDSKAVIGESGCGKTTLLEVLAGLQEPTDGSILYKGKPLSEFSRAEWKDFRSNVQIIFQDPFNSLDPKMTVRETLLEPLKIHGFDDKNQRVMDALNEVALRPPQDYADSLPKQLSGGEKQRVSIARALILEPEVILADEPVSMLDVSTQAEILNILSDLIEKNNVGLVYISHDLSTVSYVCNETNVMYLGRFVETGLTEDILRDPKHPYSDALISAIPIPSPHEKRTRTQLSGSTPDPINIVEGCRFRDRCPEEFDPCDETPEDIPVDESREVACHLYDENLNKEADLTSDNKP